MRIRQLKRSSLLFAVPLLLCATTAFASDFVKEGAAKALYREGEAHYAAGRYRQAAEKFERAYALTKQPALLFNLGNAYERMRAFDKAAARLRLYLKSPNAKGTQLISERIGRLDAAQEASMRNQGTGKTTPGTQQGSQTPQPAADSEQGGSNVLAYVLIGVGVAALGTSLGLGLAANSAGNDAEALCSEGFCSAGAKDSIDKQKGLALGADITLGVGIAAAAAGTVLLVRNLMSDERPTAEARAAQRLWVHAGLQPNGAAVGVGGRF